MVKVENHLIPSPLRPYLSFPPPPTPAAAPRHLFQHINFYKVAEVTYVGNYIFFRRGVVGFPECTFGTLQLYSYV